MKSTSDPRQSDAVHREPTDPPRHDAAAELAFGRNRHLLTVGHGTSPGAGNSTDTTYASVVQACQYLSLLDQIAAKAGKNLTVASFTKAGYALKDADIPGIGTVSFGPGQPYATGPVTIFKYDPTSTGHAPHDFRRGRTNRVRPRKRTDGWCGTCRTQSASLGPILDQDR